jgi:hypothetical protein
MMGSNAQMGDTRAKEPQANLGKPQAGVDSNN